MKDSTEDRRFRMVALDLDGTLLDSKHRVPDDTVEYLRGLQGRGFKIAIATGRAYPTVAAVVRQLLLAKPLPVVCSNGAEGYLCSVDSGTAVSKREIFSFTVPRPVVEETLRIAKKLGLATMHFFGQQIYANPKTANQKELVQRYQNMTTSKIEFVHDEFREAQEHSLPSTLLVMVPEFQDQAELMTAFEPITRSATLMNFGWFLEILHPNMSKGKGLEKMCDHLEISLDQCLAFGDGNNDIEFLKVAGKGIAMKNATDRLKKVANEVIELTNEDEGVRTTLQAMEEQGLLAVDATN